MRDSLGRIAAMTLRYWYLLRASGIKVIELVYWPTMNMVVWGLLTFWFADNKPTAIETAGSLLAAVMLWDVLFRGQLGLTFSFLEEVWSRNVANVMMSPLHPVELAASLMLMSLIRLIVGMAPVTLLALVLFSFNIYGLGFALVAFSVNLLLTSWAVGLVVCGLILRNGSGAQSFAWSVMMLLLPVCCVYYPVSILPSSLGAGHTESPSMSLLTTSIESTRLTRWNFELVALTLLGVFAIALSLMLPNSITP
jgi:ABC-2 type transport system permease protein